MKKLNKKELAMHRLLGDHKYGEKVLKICEVCGEAEGHPGVPHVFVGGGQLTAETLNENFQAMVEALQELTKRIGELEEELGAVREENKELKARKDFLEKMQEIQDQDKEPAPWKITWGDYTGSGTATYKQYEEENKPSTTG